MEDNVYRIDLNGREIILIATAHVSKESAELVERVIEAEQPHSVCVELDEGRFKTLQDPAAWEKTDIVQVIKKKQVVFLLASLALGAYQRRIAEKLNIHVGAEMVQGIKSAEAIGAHLVLADRSIQTTFIRIWRKLGFWEKMKLAYSFAMSDDSDSEITEEDLQQLLQEDMLSAVMGDMKAAFPKVGEVLITERDQYLAMKIKNAPGDKVVAVLGGAHVPGVRIALNEEHSLESLVEIPEPKAWTKALGWLIPGIILAMMAYGFVINWETGLSQLGSWVIWTGALAALFTALSFGHPLSILTSFAVAPISTLNPLLAVGWFTGLVEASLRKPTVQDVKSVATDIATVKGFFKNRFLRILLIVIMANIGASIGTFVAGLELIKGLFG